MTTVTITYLLLSPMTELIYWNIFDIPQNRLSFSFPMLGIYVCSPFFSLHQQMAIQQIVRISACFSSSCFPLFSTVSLWGLLFPHFSTGYIWRHCMLNLKIPWWWSSGLAEKLSGSFNMGLNILYVLFPTLHCYSIYII